MCFHKTISASVFPMFRYGQVLFDTHRRQNIIKSVTGWRHRGSKNQCGGRGFSARLFKKKPTTKM